MSLKDNPKGSSSLSNPTAEAAGLAAVADAVAPAPELEFHPIAEIFPMLDDESVGFKALVEDIKANGLKEPVWRYEGKVIDGRNRVRACKAAGVEIKPQLIRPLAVSPTCISKGCKLLKLVEAMAMAEVRYRGRSIEDRLVQQDRAANPGTAHLIQLYGRGVQSNDPQSQFNVQIHDAGSQQRKESDNG
jgi:hypothetical protein